MTVSSVDTITTLRNQIDALDEALANLLRERSRVSMQIQATRVVSGSPRVDLARERQVISSYAERLGVMGRDFANFVLDFCRGTDRAANSECEG